jgi:hypothetical protein
VTKYKWCIVVLLPLVLVGIALAVSPERPPVYEAPLSFRGPGDMLKGLIALAIGFIVSIGLAWLIERRKG